MTHGFKIHKNTMGFTVWSFADSGELRGTTKLRFTKPMPIANRITKINKYLKPFGFTYTPKK